MSANLHAGLPITDDDAAIEAMLADLSMPTLMLSLVHMTGDAGLIRSELKPQGLFLNEVQGFMPEPMQAEIRKLALGIIKNYRDGGCKLPAAPDLEMIQEMMSWLVCTPVPSEYIPMMLEEMELDGRDARAVEWDQASTQLRADFPVVVIGCGQSGLLAGIRLKEAGIPFTIIEKNAGVGGTWYENAYPGCRVDVGNHFYSYSFEPADHWSEYFSQQPELQGYFEEVMDRHGLRSSIRWETEVVAASWDDASGLWSVRIRDDQGREQTLTARAVISAVGQLNRAKLPDIPGIEDFQGPSFHSSNWDHSVDYEGKRVAVIGAGASGFQIVPTIAPDAAQVTVFQRTAQWMFPNPNYHKQTGPGVQWAIRHLPFYGRWYRFLLFWPGCDGGLQAARVDPDYPDPQRAVSAVNEATRTMFTNWIISQLRDDQELIDKVVPEYPPTAKRTLQDNGSWLGALTRDDVELVRDGIARIEKDAVVLEDGRRFEVDLIIYATGFHANKMLFPMQIEGRNGVVLSEHWGESPKAYLGISAPGFPNLFFMYGPGTNLAHGGSLIFHSECQMRYITGCFKALIEGDHKAMEPKQEVHDEYYERTQKELEGLVWSSPHVKHSWYKNAHGKIHILSPWRLVDYWSWTREPRLEDFDFDLAR
ncbi:MAG: NAD(P)/FAD-dependent oxidoreductase [Myxococcota bacterium]